MTEYAELSHRLGYCFKEAALLKRALTHSSYANEHRLPDGSNERLEFLGDSVLSVIVSDYLYGRFAQLPEGELTKLRASLVCERSLCQFSETLGVGEFLLLGKGEEQTGGRTRPSILADAFEAVLAAIYLDGGMSPAAQLVLGFVDQELAADPADSVRDYKTTLQEIIQSNREEQVEYRLVEETGPDHNKRFVSEVWLNTNVIGRGEGRSKKAAEQAAAMEALSLMGQI